MKRSSNSLRKDSNQLAAEIVRLSAEETTPNVQPSAISDYLSHIGRKGGLKGGRARAAKLSPARRKAIAKNAAKKRWETSPKKSLQLNFPDI